MTGSQPRRWFFLSIGIVALGVVGLLLMLRANPGAPASFPVRLHSTLIAVEELVTGERSEPTSKARRFLEADLGSAVQALFVSAEEDRFSPYKEFPKTGWPADIQRLNPVAVVYFDSKSHPDGDGIKDADYELIRRMCEQFRRVADCYLGDYYPLTPYSLENTSWMGWQFDRPERGTGLVQVFRRGESIYKSADLRLHGLDPEASYQVRNLDSPEADVIKGRHLMEIGLPVVLNDRPSAIVIHYGKIGP